MKYKEIEVFGEIRDQAAFEKAADEALNIIQKWWNNSCLKIEIEDDSVVAHTRGTHKIRVFMNKH